ncbi:MAG: hypothetical protein HQK65_09415 [Desulfamplus sp.]|nr:hypothetical protein [Desulfamplus sp.]
MKTLTVGIVFYAVGHYHGCHTSQSIMVFIKGQDTLELFHPDYMLIHMLSGELAFALHRNQDVVIDHQKVNFNSFSITMGFNSKDISCGWWGGQGFPLCQDGSHPWGIKNTPPGVKVI